MLDPHVCARCAQEGPTCCQLDPGNEESCFPLSEMERDRILRELAGDEGAFAQQANTQGFVRNLRTLFPGEDQAVDRLFPETKFHIRLAVDEQGRCRLLGPQGCRLTRESRPYYCRLFPFWYTGGKLNIFSASRCLLQREGRTRLRMLALAGESEKRLKELYGRLRLAWGLAPTSSLPAIDRCHRK
ncbi:MAG: zinc/iron-chelating domain-containing protein [Proteobacteria bacterium]|nr:zinc/iron-chelating domain-containing protein [Pseudomonadota bacterium]